MVDVLSVTGNVWQTLTRTKPTPAPFRVRVGSIGRDRFRCGNGIPVEPDAAIHEIDRADIVILPELWLGPAAVQAPNGGASAVPARVPTHSSRHTGCPAGA